MVQGIEPHSDMKTIFATAFHHVLISTKYGQLGPQRRAAHTHLTLWLQSGRGATVFVITGNFILCLTRLIVLCLKVYQILLIIKVLMGE